MPTLESPATLPRLRPALFVALLALGATGCPKGAEPAPEPGDGFAHETLAAHCWSAAPGNALLALGEDPNTFAVNFRPAPFGRSTTASAALLTRDGGRTYQKFVGDFYQGPDTRERHPLFELRTPTFIRDSFWIAGGGLTTKSAEDRSERSGLVLVLDGVPKEVDGELRALPMPDGIASDMVWKGDARRWIARSEAFLFASEDGGGSWTQVGPAPYIRNQAQNQLLLPLAWEKDRAVHYWPQDANRGFITRRGRPRQEIQWQPTRVARTNSATRAAFWNGQVVGSVFTEVLTSQDALTWTPLKTDANASSQLGLYVDAQQRLWAYPDEPSGQDADPRFKIYRWDAGSDTPTVVDLDFGPVPIQNLKSLSLLPDGRLRFLAATRGVNDFFGTFRDARGYVLCEAGPNITAQFEPVVLEPLEAVRSGRMITVARFQDSSDVHDRMAVAPSGRLYATAHQSLLAGPPDMPSLYELGLNPTVPLPKEPGLPRAPQAATETSVSVVLHTPSNLITPPPTLVASFDARTGERTSRTELTVARDVFHARQTPYGMLLATQDGTFFTNRYAPEPDGTLPPTFSNTMVVSGRHGALVDGLRYDSLFIKGPQFTLRFDPTVGPLPTTERCTSQTSRPAECIDTNDMIAADAEFDADGNLYLLDELHGRVMMLAPDSSAWVEVARGFFTPNDLHLFTVEGKTAVLVYDGDVFAFRPEPGKVKVRGADWAAATPPRMELDKRDRRGCVEAGPCLEDPAGGTLALESGSACATGRGLGAQPGQVFVGAAAAEVSSWSETQVCFRQAASNVDGLLRVLTADGRRANLIAFATSAQVTGWEVPEPLTPDAVVRVRGQNLANASVGGGTVLARGDTFIDFRVPSPGTSTVTVTHGTQSLGSRSVRVVPRVAHGCHGGRKDYCEVLGEGFGPGSTVPSALVTLGYKATVGGLSARLTLWNEQQVRMDFPAALAPGVHPVVLESPQGLRAETTAELVTVTPEVLLADQPLGTALRFGHSRPARTEEGVFVPVDKWSLGTVKGIPTPQQFDTVLVRPGTRRQDGFPPIPEQPVEVAGFPGLLNAGTPQHVVPIAGGMVIASQTKDRTDQLKLIRTRPSPAAPLMLALASTQFTQVAGLGTIGDRLVAVLGDTSAQKSTLVEVVPGATALTQGSSSTVSYSAMGDVGTSTLPAIGAWVTSAGVYLGTCRRPDVGAAVRFVPVSVNPDGSLAFGALETVLNDAAGRIIACNTTGDGLVWVRRDASGEHVESHRASTGLVQLGTLPANLPGVGQSWALGPKSAATGVSDVALLSDGDLLLLLNDSEQAPRGLRLARRRPDGTFAFSAVVAPTGLLQPGERCVGPLASGTPCERAARDGCNPFTCSLRPFQLEARPTDRIAEALLVPFGAGQDTVMAVYESVATVKTKAFAYGGTEVHAITLDVPPR